MANAKTYFEKLKKSADLNKSTTGWSHNPQTGNFNHKLHGSIALRPSARGGVEAVHNGALIGRYPDKHTAGKGVVAYMQKLPTGKSHTRMFNIPSGQVKDGLTKDDSVPPPPPQPSPSADPGPQHLLDNANPSAASAVANVFKGESAINKADLYLRGRLERSKRKS